MPIALNILQFDPQVERQIERSLVGQCFVQSESDADLIIIGPNSRDPIRLSQRCYARNPAARLVLCPNEADREEIKRAISITPAIPVDIYVANNSTGNELLAELSTLVEDKIAYKSHQTQLQAAIAASPPLAAAPSPQRLQQLETQSSFLAAIVRSSQDAIVSLDHHGKITTWNHAAETLYGYRSEDILLKPVDLLFPEEDCLHILTLLDSVLNGASTSELSSRQVRADGQAFDASLSLARITDHEGNCLGASFIARDISEQMELDRQLRRFQEDLKATNLALEAANQSLTEYAHIASHDLRAPVANILGFMSVLQLTKIDQLDDDGQMLIKYATQQAEYASDMIRALLEFSKLGAQPVEANATPLKPVIDKVLEILATEIESSGADFRIDELPTVQGDATLLERLFQNLIHNAIKYCSERPPEISISATTTFGVARIRIQDNGMGIDPKDQQRIFAPFERADAGTDRSGFGIGLATCARIVKAHQGSIELDSALDEGSAFTIRLPI